MSLGLPSARSSSARVETLRAFSTMSSLVRLHPASRAAASSQTSIVVVSRDMARSSWAGTANRPAPSLSEAPAAGRQKRLRRAGRSACGGQAEAPAAGRQKRLRGEKRLRREEEAPAGAGRRVDAGGGAGTRDAASGTRPRGPRPRRGGYSSVLAGAAVGVTVAGTGALAVGGVPATGRVGVTCAYLPRRSRMSCA